mmetsp:Transcript_31677/g.90463  ORF Transcript_31677/g.90463 Transcript_31677/m.90463 type:complete len:412 (+) Transcript_31677:150-1385(+)
MFGGVSTSPFPSPFASPVSSLGSRPFSGPRLGRCRADSEASTAVSEPDAEAGLGYPWGPPRYHKPGACSGRWAPLEQPLIQGSVSSRGVLLPAGRALAIAVLLTAAAAGAIAGWSGSILWLSSEGGWPPARSAGPRDVALQDAPLLGERARMSVMGRDVWVYAPKASQFANQSLPAVVVLHGTADYALSIANTSRFEQLAESSSKPFLAVFPEMSTPGGEIWGYMDDLPFFRALADSLDARFALDRDEVYVCGHSAGGSMSIFLQNNLPSVFSGAAAVEAGIGGLPWWNEESVGRPTMLVWNHNDPVLREFGGEALLNNTLSKLRRHAASTDQRPSFSMPVATFNASVVRRAERLLYGASGSSPPLAVVSWETALPTHLWSSPVSVPGSFDASALVWDFFQSTRVFEGRSL